MLRAASRYLGGEHEEREQLVVAHITRGHQDGWCIRYNVFVRHLEKARSSESSKESAVVRQSFYGGTIDRNVFLDTTNQNWNGTREWRYEKRTIDTQPRVVVCDIIEAATRLRGQLENPKEFEMRPSCQKKCWSVFRDKKTRRDFPSSFGGQHRTVHC